MTSHTRDLRAKWFMLSLAPGPSDCTTMETTDFRSVRESNDPFLHVTTTPFRERVANTVYILKAEHELAVDNNSAFGLKLYFQVLSAKYTQRGLGTQERGNHARCYPSNGSLGVSLRKLPQKAASPRRPASSLPVGFRATRPRILHLSRHGARPSVLSVDALQGCGYAKRQRTLWGPSLSAQRASTGSGTQTYLMAIPTGVPLNLWLHSIYVTMADSAGNALPASGAKIPFTAAAGSNSSFTINVTGPISATAPAGLQ